MQRYYGKVAEYFCIDRWTGREDGESGQTNTLNGGGIGETLNRLGRVGESAMARYLSGIILLVVFACYGDLTEASTVDVFLLAGQSNMFGNPGGHPSDLPPELAQSQSDVDFWYWLNRAGRMAHASNAWVDLAPAPAGGEIYYSIELTFGRKLANVFADRQIAIIKTAMGGTNLHTNWDPSATEGLLLYSNMISQTQTALNRLQGMYPDDDLNMAGFLWIQGAGDASSEVGAIAYEARLHDLIGHLRADLNTPDLPMWLSPIHPAIPRPYTNLVRQSQLNVADADPRVSVVNADDLELNYGCNCHYTPESRIELGYRFARAIMLTHTGPLHWDSSTSGDWGIAVNWDGTTAPTELSEVIIDPTTSVIVTGPDSNGKAWSLTIGATSGGVAELRTKNSSTLHIENTLHIQPRGKLRLNSSATVIAGITNSGELELASGAQLYTSSYEGAAGMLTFTGGTMTVVAGEFHPAAGDYTLDGTDRPTLHFGDKAAANFAADDLTIALNQSAAMNITGGSSVSNGDGHVARNASSSGSVIVDGDGSIWRNSESLYLGGSDVAAGGTAQLVVDNGGRVKVDNMLVLWPGGTVDLNNGTIVANTLDLSHGGTFNWNGGTLRPNNVIGSLDNHGGTLAPSSSPALTHISGTYSQDADATLTLKIGGNTAGSAYDVFEVDGELNLAGTLDVDLIDLGAGQFVPKIGDEFGILDFLPANLTEQFDTLDFINPGPGMVWDASHLYTTGIIRVIEGGLSADYDGDGDVDGNDFLVWQNNFPTFGGATVATGDSDKDADVDGEDFLSWQNQFPTRKPLVITPEPTSGVLFAISIFLVVRRHR